VTETKKAFEPGTLPFAHLLNYGLISNGRLCALVSMRGSMDFLCMPAFDGPFVFDKLLDAQQGGFFDVLPAMLDGATVSQSYKKTTAVLVTRFVGPHDAFALIDFMPRWDIWDGSQPHTPPEVCRYIQVLHGEPEINVRFLPKAGYTADMAELTVINTSTIQCRHQADNIYLLSNMPPEQITGKGTICLKNDMFFLLSYGHQPQDVGLGDIKTRLDRTVQFWHRWVKNCYLPDDYQAEIIRSAITLKQLIYEPTGAMIAAPTTSVPEIIGGYRNWDYRFCWVRDSFFMVNALLKLSKFEETENYVAWLSRIILNHTGIIKPLYTIDGQDVPEVSTLDYLAGYQQSKPVRIGNDATLHHQTDAYGEAMLSLYPLFMDERVVRHDDDRLWACVEMLATMAIEKFGEKDNGIWEIGDRPDHYTFSKLLCWVAMDRGCKIAYYLNKNRHYRRWSVHRKYMRADILRQAWNPEVNAFTQAYGGTDLDASTLLMSALGIIDPRDTRMLATIQRSEELLMVDGLMFRYTNDDELGIPENAFTLCTFWLIDALTLSGQKRKARKYFEQLLTYGNHLGLYSEHINPKTGEMTGNFPQGYTHVAIINSAMLLADAKFKGD
jgi:alpha,alpha-trehalase